LLLSVGVHAAIFAGLGTFRLDPYASASVPPVEISVVESPPPPPAPEVTPAPEPPAPVAEPEPVKPPPPPKVRERAPKPVETPPPEQATPPPAAAQAETIADFSGTTLTGEGQGGWLSAVGTGGAMNGPIGRPGAVVTGRNREGVAAGGVIDGTGVRLVGESDLSRRPKLPSSDILNEALERNYPKTARQQGIEGSASIKLRILANGKIEPLRKDGSVAVAAADTWGFGDACLKALKEVAQQHRVEETPLDRQGQPAATEIRFKCTFSVE
jgi:outer membrane biosynthesis protein TonB